MDSMSEVLERTLRRARRRYEWTRARRALLGFLPMAVLIGLACAASDRPVWASAFGSSLFALGVVVLWYGRDLRRAVLPGVVAGIVPLGLVMGARHLGHTCDGLTCTSLCLTACVVGGALAGLVVGSSKLARSAGPGFWLVASSLAVLTGAIACARLGAAGIVGLLLGYLLGAAPTLASRALKS